jgi:hypothetical protein
MYSICSRSGSTIILVSILHCCLLGKRPYYFWLKICTPFCRGIISEETKRESCSCLGIITVFALTMLELILFIYSGDEKGLVSREFLAPFFKNLACSHHGFKIVTVADYKFDFFIIKRPLFPSLASLNHLNINTVFEKVLRIKYNNFKKLVLHYTPRIEEGTGKCEC